MKATTHVRLAVATVERLKEEIRRLVAAHEEGFYSCPLIDPDTRNPAALPISLDGMIRLLLDMRQRHRERRRKAGYGRPRRRKLPPARVMAPPAE